METQECEATKNRICTKCEEDKPLTEYSRRRRSPTSEYTHLTQCKECIRARDRAKYEADPEPKKAARQRYADVNRDSINANSKVYRETNRDRINVRAAGYRAGNRGVLNQRSKTRYEQADKAKIAARKQVYRLANIDTIRAKQQEWDAANRDKVHDQYLRNYARNKGTFIKNALKRSKIKAQAIPKWFDNDAVNAIYIEAQRLTQEYGIQYHVDHIVPLNGKKVCGLHIFDNLQILTAEENLRKSNKFYG